MKKIAVLVVMVVGILIGSVLLTAFAGPKMGHVRTWSSAGFITEYDYVEANNGETIRFNETTTWWK